MIKAQIKEALLEKGYFNNKLTFKLKIIFSICLFILIFYSVYLINYWNLIHLINTSQVLFVKYILPKANQHRPNNTNTK